MSATAGHLENCVLPAAKDYEAAEATVSEAFQCVGNAASDGEAAAHAKRRAAELAIAIDGLRERAAKELSKRPEDVHREVAALWVIDGVLRQGCLDRIRAMAAAYRHGDLDQPRHPIASERDVLVVGAGYGIEGYGLGKFGGIEVLMQLKDGSVKKMLGDVPFAVAGWLAYLKKQLNYDPGAIEILWDAADLT